MRDVLGVRRPVELSADVRFAGRVVRLALTSLVALGIIWGLAVTTLHVPPAVLIALAGGWALMPILLAASLRRPLLRYGLMVPAGLVTVSLLAITLAWRPADPLAATGWLLMAAGVLLGGGLGLWFWFRLLPVPAGLDDPFSTGRLVLIRAHVALILLGMCLAALPLL